MLVTSSDTKRTLMHLFLFTNSSQRELVSICTQSMHNRARNLKEYYWTKLPSFLIGGLNICVDFDLRDLKEMENINKLNKTVFHNKNIDIYKTCLTPFVKPGF